MDARPLVAAAAVTAAFAVPAVVLADGVGPHANGYQQHPGSTKPQDDVSLVVHRDTHKADLYVNNFCLGSESSPGSSTKYPNGASARGVRVRKGNISYKGSGTIFTQSGQQKVAMRFAATVKPKTASGTAKFPGTQCGTIAFTAKLTQHTK
jgi:hypothetical protein